MLSKGHLLRGSRLHAAIPGSVQARLYSSLNTEKKPDEAEVRFHNLRSPGACGQITVVQVAWSCNGLPFNALLRMCEHVLRFCDMLQHGSEYSSDKAKQSADFFTAGVRSTIGTVVQVSTPCFTKYC